MARIPQLLIREKRLDALGAYLGGVAPLIAELESGALQRIRTFAQTTPDDIVQALTWLGGLDGAGIVVHGARGCAGVLPLAAPHGRWAVTNLDQRDTILGSDDVLAQTVRALHDRHRPWAIFIVATPVVAINNDDISAVAAELTDELEIPVIEVRSDGFRSRIAATGADAAAQALLPLIIPTEAARDARLVNLLAVEAGRGVAEIARLIEGLGLAVNLLPHGADADGLQRAATAALSVTVDPDRLEALGRGLEQSHGVPLLRLPPPIGVAATQRFVAAIAAATNRAVPTPSAATLASILQGRRVALAQPAAAGFALADLIEELGGEVISVSVDAIDTSHLAALKDFAARHPTGPVHVADGQPFEHVNRLARLKPDLFVGPPELAVLAARAGIAAVAARPDDLFGYTGAARLARQAAKALGNTKLVARLASRGATYQANWFRRSPDWYIKFEVR